MNCEIEGFIPESGAFTERSTGTVIKFVLDPTSAAVFYAFLARSRQMGVPTFKATIELTTPATYGLGG